MYCSCQAQCTRYLSWASWLLSFNYEPQHSQRLELWLINHNIPTFVPARADLCSGRKELNQPQMLPSLSVAASSASHQARQLILLFRKQSHKTCSNRSWTFGGQWMHKWNNTGGNKGACFHPPCHTSFTKPAPRLFLRKGGCKGSGMNSSKSCESMSSLKSDPHSVISVVWVWFPLL